MTIKPRYLFIRAYSIGDAFVSYESNLCEAATAHFDGFEDNNAYIKIYDCAKGEWVITEDEYETIYAYALSLHRSTVDECDALIHRLSILEGARALGLDVKDEEIEELARRINEPDFHTKGRGREAFMRAWSEIVGNKE